MDLLIKRLTVDIANMEWNLTNPLSPEEINRFFEVNESIGEEVKMKYIQISEKDQYCLENNLVRYSAFQFTYGYVSVPVEFQLRELYESQMPIIRWIQDNIPLSEEKGYLQSLVESMERKYLLTL